MNIPKVGDRIRLTHMGKDPDPIQVGTEGEVTRVAIDVQQIGVKWDNGRGLNLLIGVDQWEIVS